MKPPSPQQMDRIAAWAEQAPLERKARLMGGADTWHIEGIEELGLAPLEVADCGHGITKVTREACRATCLPTAVGMASTWNPDLMEEAGALLGRECKALGVGMLLGPMINLHRLPCNGRNYETFSEDPVLTGVMGAALIRGIQSEGVAACAKVLTANNQQTHQLTASAEVEDHVLRELYLAAMRMIVRDADPAAIMTSYNRVNGLDSASNRYLLYDIVKRGWGYRGILMSDWGGVHDTTPIAAGLDLEMPGPPRHLTRENIIAAVSRGELTEAELNDRAARVASVTARYQPDPADRGELDSERHRTIARRVAEESIVLLKNEQNLLPLDADRLQRVLVVGPNAKNARLGGGGSASVSPTYSVSPLAGLLQRLPRHVEVDYLEGCSFYGDTENMRGCFTPPGETEPGSGLAMHYFRTELPEGEPVHTMLADGLDEAWGWSSPAPGVPRDVFSVRCEGTVTFPEAGTYTLMLTFQGGGVRMLIDGRPAIDAWETDYDTNFESRFLAGMEQVELFADAGESRRIVIEYSKHTYSSMLRLDWIRPAATSPLSKALASAENADAVIVCAGLSNIFEGGAQDRKQHAMPGRQDELIRELVRVNPRVVVCLQNGSPVAMPWLNEVPALLECWYPGQEGGNALAAVLMGDVNPSGRLPDTLPASWEDVPAMQYWPGTEEKTEYGEGFMIGYRHSVSGGPAPLFPFGFGLSYTTFAYRDLVIEDCIVPDSEFSVRVTVSNTGRRAGRETVQLYIGSPYPSRPAKELAAFQKPLVKAGASAEVTFRVPIEALAHIDPVTGAWVMSPGEYPVTVGPDCTRGLSGVVILHEPRTPRPGWLLESISEKERVT